MNNKRVFHFPKLKNDLIPKVFNRQPVERVPDYVRVSSSAVIFTDDNKILLQRRSDNKYWGLPGGGVEPGETPEICIRVE